MIGLKFSLNSCHNSVFTLKLWENPVGKPKLRSMRLND